MKIKKKTIKGRLAWADMKQGRFENKPICRINLNTDVFADITTPVLVLPLDDLDGLVEQTMLAVNGAGDWSYSNRPEPDAIARHVLSSLGVRFPKQRKAHS